MYINILTSVSSRILTITINRESKLNALNIETLHELNLALEDAFQDTNIAGIIITGAGSKAFAAGADIRELKELDQAGGYNLAHNGHTKVFNLIAHSQKPVIAAINGFALGGGLELALACHIRIASENARLGLPEVSLGLIPGYGGTQRLPQLIGRGKAFEMILSGDMITAKEALEIGLINHMVGAGQVLDKSYELLGRIKSRSPLATSAAIRAINAANTAAGYDVEIKEFSQCFGSADFQEGTEAFLEKRTANFIK